MLGPLGSGLPQAAGGTPSPTRRVAPGSPPAAPMPTALTAAAAAATDPATGPPVIAPLRSTTFEPAFPALLPAPDATAGGAFSPGKTTQAAVQAAPASVPPDPPTDPAATALAGAEAEDDDVFRSDSPLGYNEGLVMQAQEQEDAAADARRMAVSWRTQEHGARCDGNILFHACVSVPGLQDAVARLIDDLAAVQRANTHNANARPHSSSSAASSAELAALAASPSSPQAGAAASAASAARLRSVAVGPALPALRALQREYKVRLQTIDNLPPSLIAG